MRKCYIIDNTVIGSETTTIYTNNTEIFYEEHIQEVFIFKYSYSTPCILKKLMCLTEYTGIERSVRKVT